jgi:hypothetical protein
MVVDKASGRDSPLRQGAEIELLDPPDLASTTAVACSMIRGKEIRCLGFFPSRGLYRRKGIIRGGTRWSHHMVARPGAGPHHPMVSLAPGPPPSHLWSSRSFGKNRRFGFCFVQFREYFMCNFSETKNSRKQGTGTMASC